MDEEKNLAKHMGMEKELNKNHRKAHMNGVPGSSLKQLVIKKKNKNKKQKKGHQRPSKDGSASSSSKTHQNNKAEKVLNCHVPLKSQASTLRKRVDPETAKYFTEISNLFQNNEIDLEERSAICANALEETRGKEVELATDMIISHTLQNLLEGCDLDQLCAFLRSCVNGFPIIAMDKFGSHVAETAIKSLARHLEEEGSYSFIEATLTKICQVVVTDAINVMCSQYGSHVLRSLLCLCKGVSLDSLEDFHVTKREAILAERLNIRPAKSVACDTENSLPGFAAVFKFLVKEILIHAGDEIKTLRANKYSSFVLQTALKLLVGDDEELLHTILVLLGCHEKNAEEGKVIGAAEKQEMMVLLEDTASSHLLEVIIQVAPESLYSDFVTGVFRGSLFEISSHHCGNFVVQALVSSAKTKDHMDFIWKELGTKFKELLELGKPGVIASILAACQRLQAHVFECSQALAAAVSLDSESSSSIVPHILFLHSFLREKSCWKRPVGDKMHVLGCLMLQTIFRCPKQDIHPYILSITTMDGDHILQMAKDAGGGRVLEAFICSDVSTKLKLKVITKLKDHYGDLAMNPSSSFTVEKCFSAGNVSLKETIAQELLEVQTELSQTKHGPYLLKKLDIAGFGSRPEQWKLKQASKESAYKKFQDIFGSESKPFEKNVQASMSSQKSSKPKSHEDIFDNAHNAIACSGSESGGLEVSMTELGFPGKKQAQNRSVHDKTSKVAEHDSNIKKFIRNKINDSFVKKSGKRKSSPNDLADLAGKSKLNAGDVRKLFKSPIKIESEQTGDERVPFLRRQKK